MLFMSIITLTLLTSVLALPTPQLAGEGQFFDAIFTDTDNGVGYGIENAENNLAATISGTKTNPTGGSGSTGGGNPPPPPPPGPHRRQLDKISNGFQTLSSSLGAGDSTKQMTDTLDSVDGTLTSDAANLGQNVGGTEESFLEGMGNAVPRV